MWSRTKQPACGTQPRRCAWTTREGHTAGTRDSIHTRAGSDRRHWPVLWWIIQCEARVEDNSCLTMLKVEMMDRDSKVCFFIFVSDPWPWVPPAYLYARKFLGTCRHTPVCVPMVRWLWHIPLNQTRISLVGEFLYWGIPSEQGPRCLSRLVTKNLEPLFTADRNKEVAGVIKEEEQEGHLLKIKMPPMHPMVLSSRCVGNGDSVLWGCLGARPALHLILHQISQQGHACAVEYNWWMQEMWVYQCPWYSTITNPISPCECPVGAICRCMGCGGGIAEIICPT